MVVIMVKSFPLAEAYGTFQPRDVACLKRPEVEGGLTGEAF